MALSLERAGSLGNTVTRQDLYNLLSNCTLTGTAAGVSVGRTLGITAVSEAPAVPSDGNTWWYDRTQNLLKVPLNSANGSPCSMWLSVGPDAWQIPVLNSNSYTLPKGSLCSWKQTGGLYDVDYLRPYSPAINTPRSHLEALRTSSNARGYAGALQDDLGPGAIGALTWYGFAYVKCTGFGDDNGIPTAQCQYNYPAYITISTAHTGTAFAVDSDDVHSRPNVLGGLISHPTDTGGTLPDTVCPCLLDGPWNSGTVLGANATSMSVF